MFVNDWKRHKELSKKLCKDCKNEDYYVCIDCWVYWIVNLDEKKPTRI